MQNSPITPTSSRSPYRYLSSSRDSKLHLSLSLSFARLHSLFPFNATVSVSLSLSPSLFFSLARSAIAFPSDSAFSPSLALVRARAPRRSTKSHAASRTSLSSVHQSRVSRRSLRGYLAWRVPSPSVLRSTGPMENRGPDRCSAV